MGKDRRVEILGKIGLPGQNLLPVIDKEQAAETTVSDIDQPVRPDQE